MVFFQGRIMAGVAAVILLMLSVAVFIFSCASDGVTGRISSFITGLPAASACVGWIPLVVGVTLSSVLAALAVVAMVQVVTG